MRSVIGPLVPIALLFVLLAGVPIAWIAWNHHDIHLESPIVADDAAAQAWLSRQTATQPCIAISIETKINAASAGPGAFAEFRCDTPAAYWRVGFGLLGPAIAIFGLALALRSAKR